MRLEHAIDARRARSRVAPRRAGAPRARGAGASLDADPPARRDHLERCRAIHAAFDAALAAARARRGRRAPRASSRAMLERLRGARDRRRPRRRRCSTACALFDVARASPAASRSSRGRRARWRSPSASCSSTTPRRTARTSPRCSTPGSASRRGIVVLPRAAPPARPRRPRPRRSCSRAASRPRTCVAMDHGARAACSSTARSRARRGDPRSTTDGDARAATGPARPSTVQRRRSCGAAGDDGASRSRQLADAGPHTPRGGRRVPRGAHASRSSRARRHLRVARRGRGRAPPALGLRPAVVAAARAHRRTPTSGTSRSSSRPARASSTSSRSSAAATASGSQDPLNPNRARDPFGANSVAARRRATRSPSGSHPDPRRAPGHARASSAFDSEGVRRDARVGALPAGALPRDAPLPAARRPRRQRLPALRGAEARCSTT